MDGISNSFNFFKKYMITGLHTVKQLPVESMCCISTQNKFTGERQCNVWQNNRVLNLS